MPAFAEKFSQPHTFVQFLSGAHQLLGALSLVPRPQSRYLQVYKTISRAFKKEHNI